MLIQAFNQKGENTEHLIHTLNMSDRNIPIFCLVLRQVLLMWCGLKQKNTCSYYAKS